MDIPTLNPLEYRYDLPENRIPDRPLPDRSSSNLLVYKNKQISKVVFRQIDEYLPSQALLIFNQSKVIPARLLFKTQSAATVELLCLHPHGIEKLSEEGSHQSWVCIVGNLKRWKQTEVLQLEVGGSYLRAELLHRGGENNVVTFHWHGQLPFFDLLEKLGEIPLPPYMLRKADATDKIRYQTVYATHPGSVAAPTAGLHFTETILTNLKSKGYSQAYLTLHVGAGTFKPIKTDSVALHTMHEEQFEVTKDFLNLLIQTETVIPVGTTSARVLESLCHLGHQFLQNNFELHVNQWAGFVDGKPSKQACLQALLAYLEVHKLTKLTAKTSLMIVPGYQFMICKGLITNFHQPESTLILLVAALIGDQWRSVYEFALANDFRFLSYGDSSLLIP